MRIHHVGIASMNIEDSIKNCEKMHKVIGKTKIIFDEKQDAYLAYLETGEGLNVEFIAGKQVENIIKRGVSYYHLCYEVSNLEDKIEELKKSGAIVVSDPKPSLLFKMRKVAFLYTPYGLIELLEENSK